MSVVSKIVSWTVALVSIFTFGRFLARETAPTEITEPLTEDVTTEATEPAPQEYVVPPPTEEEVYYANCDEAREAGAENIHISEPGYRPALDRDNDDYACDTYNP